MDGNYVVSDSYNHRIQVFTPGGVWLRKFGSKGEEPGFPFFIHCNSKRLNKFSINSSIWTKHCNWFSCGREDLNSIVIIFATMILPDRLYPRYDRVVVEEGNHRIQVLKLPPPPPYQAMSSWVTTKNNEVWCHRPCPKTCCCLARQHLSSEPLTGLLVTRLFGLCPPHRIVSSRTYELVGSITNFPVLFFWFRCSHLEEHFWWN